MNGGPRRPRRSTRPGVMGSGAPPALAGERGSVAATTAVLIVVLLVFAALTVDVGLATLARRHLQNAGDAAALDGAAELDGTQAGLDRARARAEAVAAAHAALRDPVVLSQGGGDGTPDVQVGTWDFAAATFTESGDPAAVNAVRVQARRYSARGEGIATTFGQLAGVAAMDVGSDAIAVGGGAGEVECASPVAVPRCSMDLNPSWCVDPVPLSFNPSTTNTAGFGVFAGTASTPNIAAQLQTCSDYRVGDTLCLGNGANLASPQIYQPMVDSIVAGEPWDDATRPLPAQDPASEVPSGDYGKVWRTWIPVFDDGGSFCSPPDNYNQCGWKVDSFVPFAMYDVLAHGSTKTVLGFFDCDATPGLAYAGGTVFDTEARPRLVR